MNRLLRYPGSFLKQLRFDFALDLTRLGERLTGAPKLTKRDIMYQTADLRNFDVSPYSHVDPSAVITGNVNIQDGVSVGKGCVIRADSHAVDIFYGSSIGEGTIIVSTSRKPANPTATNTVIGVNSHIGKRCVLSSARVMGATIGDDCVIGECAIVHKGAVVDSGTVIPSGTIVPEGTRWGGNPAKYMGMAEAH